MLNQLNFISDLEKTEKEKKSRIILLIFLGLTIIPSFVFWTIARWQENPPKITSFFEKVDFSRQDQDSTNLYRLNPYLNTWAESNFDLLAGNWSVKLKFIDSEFSWQRYSLRRFQVDDELLNLVVLTAYYHLVETENLVLDNQSVVDTGFSDSNLNQALIDEIGQSKINLLLLKWGMKNTDLSDQLTNAEDLSLFFAKLYDGEIISGANKETLLDNLASKPQQMVEPGLPQGLVFAGQDGFANNTVYAAGIVYFPENPYILVILGEGAGSENNQQTITDTVNDLYWIIADNI